MPAARRMEAVDTRAAEEDRTVAAVVAATAEAVAARKVRGARS